MKVSLLLLAAVSSAKNIAGVQFLNFNVSRGSDYETSVRGAPARLVRRADVDGTVLMELANQQSFYSVDLKVGSDQQSVVVLVDTGSSDLWVTGSDNPYCSSSSSKMAKRFREVDDDAPFKRDSGLSKYRKLDDVDFKKGLGLGKFREVDDAEFKHELGLSKGRKLDDKAFKDSLLAENVVPSGTVQKAVADLASVSSSMATIDCSQYGTFDSSSSTTFHSNGSEFFIVYGDSSFAYGVWGYDTVEIDGVTVDNLSFAVANQTNSSVGVLGIGLEGLETTYSGSSAGSNGYTYANLPSKMVQDGLINKRVYSLFLNSVDADSGSILFGGVDTAKYEGSLTSVPIINTLASSGYSTAIKIEVTLSDVTFDGSSSLSDPIAVLLDSGTTLTYLPSDTVSAIASQVGATYSSSYGYYLLSCPSDSAASENITFSFQGVNIQAPLSNFILSADSTGSTCVLGLISSTTYILGDSFLRSAYLVYDLDDLTVSLAQAVFTNDENIKVITDSVPGTVAASDSSTATAGGSGSTVATGGVTISVTGSSGSGSATGAGTSTASRSSATASSSSTSSSSGSSDSSSGAVQISTSLMVMLSAAALSLVLVC